MCVTNNPSIIHHLLYILQIQLIVSVVHKVACVVLLVSNCYTMQKQVLSFVLLHFVNAYNGLLVYGFSTNTLRHLIPFECVIDFGHVLCKATW